MSWSSSSEKIGPLAQEEEEDAADWAFVHLNSRFNYNLSRYLQHLSMDDRKMPLACIVCAKCIDRSPREYLYTGVSCTQKIYMHIHFFKDWIFVPNWWTLPTFFFHFIVMMIIIYRCSMSCVGLTLSNGSHSSSGLFVFVIVQIRIVTYWGSPKWKPIKKWLNNSLTYI